MATCLVFVVAVGLERAVEGTVGREVLEDLSSIVAVAVQGSEGEKQSIAALELLSKLAGAQLHTVTIRPGSAEDAAELYRVLRGLECDRVVLVGAAEAPQLFPVLFMVLLQVWKEKRVEAYMLYSIGEGASLEGLAGFAAPGLKVSSLQKMLIRAVYSSPAPELEVQDLMRELRLGRSAYYALQDLNRKGLVKYSWGKIRRTFVGELYYRVAICGGEPSC